MVCQIGYVVLVQERFSAPPEPGKSKFDAYPGLREISHLGFVRASGFKFPISMAPGLNGQQDAKSSAFAGCTFDFDFAVMSFDNYACLEHADAEALFLGGLKRMEKKTLHELRGHATTVVRNAENSPTVALAGFDFDLAAGGQSIARVQDKV